VSSFTIVAVPLSSPKTPFSGLDSWMRNVSSGSTSQSPFTRTGTVNVVFRAGMLKTRSPTPSNGT
jgi:hypothetical protein